MTSDPFDKPMFDKPKASCFDGCSQAPKHCTYRLAVVSACLSTSLYYSIYRTGLMYRISYAAWLVAKHACWWIIQFHGPLPGWRDITTCFFFPTSSYCKRLVSSWRGYLHLASLSHKTSCRPCSVYFTRKPAEGYSGKSVGNSLSTVKVIAHGMHV